MSSKSFKCTECGVKLRGPRWTEQRRTGSWHQTFTMHASDDGTLVGATRLHNLCATCYYEIYDASSGEDATVECNR